jgi:pilus assembly protein Flp/PilA
MTGAALALRRSPGIVGATELTRGPVMLFLRRLFVNSRGATAIEYALIASLISVAAMVGYHSLGDGLTNSFDNTADKL